MSTLAELYKKAPLGETKFFQYAKKRLPGVTTKQVKEFLTAQKAHQETRVQGSACTLATKRRSAITTRLTCTKRRASSRSKGLNIFAW